MSITVEELKETLVFSSHRGKPYRKTIRSAEERFWAGVDKRGPDDCWEWKRSRYKGYGEMALRGRTVRTHRVSFILAYGEIPPELVVRHRCDNPPCCNPAHLELGTPADNNDDMVRRGRYNGFKPGLANVRGALPDERVREVRAAYAAGASIVEITARMNLNHTHVSRIVRGELRSTTE